MMDDALQTTLRPVELEPTEGRRNKSMAGLAVRDIIDGLRLWRLWGLLGWNDIAQRYRRSIFGPFWLTISMAVMVVALGFLYAKLFQVPINEFIPFLCIGLLVWGYLSSFLLEGGTLFVASETYIKQIRLPFSAYAYRAAWSKTIIFAHNFLIYFGVIAYFRIWPGPVALLALLGFLLITLNGWMVSIILGMASARFRDIPQLIASLVQIVFFVTPIIWKPELLKDQIYLASWNPFHAFIDIVRAPLLGQAPPASTYVLVLAVTLVNAMVLALFFGRYRSRIPYWI
jgi:ABC-2 type transport system permease protein/lipopolysaccharide transport system permease protein